MAVEAETGAVEAPGRPSLRSRVNQPSKRLALPRLTELWAYRDLLYFLTWRDVKVRYKQTFLGVAWAILQPVLTVAIFTVIFGWLLKVPSGGVPYALFALVGLIPWQLFAGSLQRAGTSLVVSGNLLTKVYFPRLLIPISAVAAAIVDFAFSLVVLLALMLYYGYTPSLVTLWVIPLVALALATALAVGLWLSALNVLYRDVQQLIPFLIQAWMYASPIVYPANIIHSPTWRLLYSLNPMVGVIDGFRWALVGGPAPGLSVLMSSGIVTLLMVTGLFYFHYVERIFADVV